MGGYPCTDSQVFDHKMLRAATSRARVPVATFRRNLGDTTRGPGHDNISLAVNAKHAKAFFTKGAVSYAEYKQQCQSLRLFVFMAAVAFPVVSLAVNPPKSSYWATYSPLYWFRNTRSAIVPSKDPVFLTQKVERESNVPEIHDSLVTL